MKEYLLNGAAITDKHRLHRTLAGLMNLPEYYGNNLDALMDVLTDITDPVCLVIVDNAALEQNLGEYYPKLRKVLDDAQEENLEFSYRIL